MTRLLSIDHVEVDLAQGQVFLWESDGIDLERAAVTEAAHATGFELKGVHKSE